MRTRGLPSMLEVEPEKTECESPTMCSSTSSKPSRLRKAATIRAKFLCAFGEDTARTYGLALPLRSAPLGGWNLAATALGTRSEEHTSELQSLMRISYAVFCLKKKQQHIYYKRKRVQEK